MKREASDLLIRKVDRKLKDELKKRARAHGRSLSDEAKAVLRRGMSEEPRQEGMGTRLFSLLPAEFRGDDFVFEAPGEMGEPPDFE